MLTLLFIKHFIVDFLLQNPYQWQNKGTYGHPGGLLHAGLHGVATLLILVFFTEIELALFLAMTDAIIHYHIDWAKMNLNKKFGYTPADEKFWWLLGLDQLLHSLTYILIVSIIL
jgi:hypothetical protein